jgi:hypothetical protein
VDQLLRECGGTHLILIWRHRECPGKCRGCGPAVEGMWWDSPDSDMEASGVSWKMPRMWTSWRGTPSSYTFSMRLNNINTRWQKQSTRDENLED